MLLISSLLHYCVTSSSTSRDCTIALLTYYFDATIMILDNPSKVGHRERSEERMKKSHFAFRSWGGLQEDRRWKKNTSSVHLLSLVWFVPHHVTLTHSFVSTTSYHGTLDGPSSHTRRFKKLTATPRNQLVVASQNVSTALGVDMIGGNSSNSRGNKDPLTFGGREPSAKTTLWLPLPPYSASLPLCSMRRHPFPSIPLWNSHRRTHGRLSMGVVPSTLPT
jgi:hypothetical protein